MSSRARKKCGQKVVGLYNKVVALVFQLRAAKISQTLPRKALLNIPYRLDIPYRLLNISVSIRELNGRLDEVDHVGLHKLLTLEIGRKAIARGLSPYPPAT